MSFHEVRLPTSLALGARGGPGFKTTIVTLASGAEARNEDWQKFRARYSIAFPPRATTAFQTLIDFFVGRRGMAYGFRFLDRLDYRATDEAIGTGDGTTTEFQLVKTYDVSGPLPYARTIAKPVSGSVSVKIDGAAQGSGWTVDTTTGIVTFTPAPALGVAITASYEFDVPVRFDTDLFDAVRDLPDVASLPDIPLIEVRI